MGSSSLRRLNQSTQVRVAHSTVSSPAKIPVDHLGLVQPLMVSAKALSYESPTLPTRARCRLGQALGITDRHVLHPRSLWWIRPLRPNGWRAQRACSAHPARSRCGRSGTPSADNVPGEHVDDEGHIDEPLCRRHIREIGYPQRIRTLRRELAVDPILRTGGFGC